MAVRNLIVGVVERPPDKEVMSPLFTMTLPAPQRSITSREGQNLPLPPREMLLASVSCFFEQVHCTYWLFSSEEFYGRVEDSYADIGEAYTNSWMCILYSVTALGALNTPPAAHQSEESDATRYLDVAKSYLTGVCDEADLDSIKALILMVRPPRLGCGGY